MDLVFAVRQPLSAPTWAKPMVMLSLAALSVPALASSESEPPHALSDIMLRATAAAATRVFFSTVYFLSSGGPSPLVTGVTGDECER